MLALPVQNELSMIIQKQYPKTASKSSATESIDCFGPLPGFKFEQKQNTDNMTAQICRDLQILPLGRARIFAILRVWDQVCSIQHAGKLR